MVAIVTALGVPLAAVLEALGLDINSATGTLCLILLYLATYLGLVHFLVVRPGALTWHDVVRPAHLAPDPGDWAPSTPWPVFPATAAALAGTLRSRIGRSRFGDVLFALAMLAPIIVASSVVDRLLLAVLGLQSNDISSPVPNSPAGLDFLITMLVVAAIVPIGEETFFRGFATNAWGRSLGRNQAMLRGAMFFAFIHVLNVNNTDPSLAFRAAAFNFGARIPVAVALTWLYLRRRSILASGALHASYNGLILLLSLTTT
jgi:membrane protease YdiL (CAAX protease family)